LQLAETMLALAMEFSGIDGGLPRLQGRARATGVAEWFAESPGSATLRSRTRKPRIPQPSKLHSVPNASASSVPTGHDRRSVARRWVVPPVGPGCQKMISQ